MDVAGGPPSGENLDVAFVNAAENGVERFDGAFAGTHGDGDGGGGSGAVAEGGPLLAFAAGEFVSQPFEIAGGVRRVAVGLELVIESEFANGGSDGTGAGREVVITLAVRHTEALHEGGVGGFLGDGGGGEVDVAEFFLQFVAEDALNLSLLAKSAAGLDGLLAAEVGDGSGQAEAHLRSTGVAGWWVKSGTRVAANSEERMSAWASFCWRRFMG